MHSKNHRRNHSRKSHTRNAHRIKTRAHKKRVHIKTRKYKKRGGANCGSSGCPIAPMSTKTMNKYGGSFYKPALPMPGPTIGQPWGAKVGNWAGVQGIGNDRTYLAPYAPTIINDPTRQMKLSNGGGRGKRRKRTLKTTTKHKGGSNLGNLVNSLSFEMKSAYNSLNGYEAPINPLPYKDQLS